MATNGERRMEKQLANPPRLGLFRNDETVEQLANPSRLGLLRNDVTEEEEVAAIGGVARGISILKSLKAVRGGTSSRARAGSSSLKAVSPVDWYGLWWRGIALVLWREVCLDVAVLRRHQQLGLALDWLCVDWIGCAWIDFPKLQFIQTDPLVCQFEPQTLRLWIGCAWIDFPKPKSMIIGFVQHEKHGDQGNMVVGVVEEMMAEGGKGRKGGWLEEGGRFDEWYAIDDGGGGSRTEFAMKDGVVIRMELVMWGGVLDVGRRVGPASMRMVGGGDEGSGGPPGPSD